MDEFNFVNNDKVVKLEPMEGTDYETIGMCEDNNLQLTELANVVKSETVKSENNKTPFRSRILFEEDIFGDIKKEDILNEINKISDYIDETENIDCNTGKASPAKDSDFLVDSNEDSTEFVGDVPKEKLLHPPNRQHFSNSDSESMADSLPGPSINEKPLSPPSPPTLSYLSSMLNPGPSKFNFLVDYNEKNSTRTKKPLHPSKRRRLDPDSESAVADVLPDTSMKTEPSSSPPSSPPSSPTPSYLSSMLNPGQSTLKLCRSKDFEESPWDVDFSTLLAYGSDNSDAEDDDEFPDVSHDRVDMDAFFIDEEETATQELKTEPLCELTSSTVIGPTNLFNFEWKDFPNPPVPPAERREVFSDINSGPTAPFLTPYDAFTAIWNLEIMEYIVLETNRYAQQVADKQYRDGSLGPNSRIALWQDTNVNELFVFFALILGTALCIKGELKDYWSKEGPIATPYFGQYMSYNRFSLLCRCIHFNNNTTDIQTMTRLQAKIFKIAPVVQHLNHQFQSLYNLNRNIALDESLTQWKGWLDVTQFIENKARGIKTYQVCDAETGYLWRFKLNAGREEGVASETPVSDVIECPVLELLEGLENKGHTVWMDNYYNSPALARVLKSMGFDCVGTLRTNRQFVPAQLANLQKLDMAVGQISGLTSGDVDVMVWRDKNRVGLISTYHGVDVYTNKEGIVKPTVVRDYNRWMGGVDKRNQTLSAYPLERKRSQVWYKKLFKRLLNISILNAFILYQHNSLDKEARGCKHRDFRKTLFNEILEINYIPSTSRSIPNFNNADSPEISMEFLDHLPTEYGLLKAKRMKGREKLRRACAVCHRRISMQCQTCNVPLCLITCFKKYHINKFVLSK